MTFKRLQCPSFSFLGKLLCPLGSDLDQLEVNAPVFSQCSPLLGGNQTEDKNQLLQKNQPDRQGNPLCSHPLVHSHQLASVHELQ